MIFFFIKLYEEETKIKNNQIEVSKLFKIITTTIYWIIINF